MPTGYTAGVVDGTVDTFEKFALLSARAFGATITMRDEPLGVEIPEKFEPDSYYSKRVEIAREKLDKITRWTDEDAEADQDEHIAETERRNAESAQRAAAVSERCKNMMASVEAWKPPTADHVRMRTFMREQLADIIAHEGTPWRVPVPERVSAAKWKAGRIANAERELERAVSEELEEVERCDSRTKWVAELRASLK